MGLFTKSLWKWGRDLATSVVNGVNSFMKNTGIDRALSYVTSIIPSIIQHTTTSDINVLKSKVVIAPPQNQDLNHTPTMSQFINAANAEYTLYGTPKDLEAFTINGRQMAIQDEVSGMAARVWETPDKQVIISFQGTTGGDNALINPLIGVTQAATDVLQWNQEVSQSQKDALGFTKYVVGEAQKRGINTNNIFVTGHSLGGVEASYVGQQTGLAGVAFESTGVPDSTTAKGDGSNFINVVTDGDPVGNYASDTGKDLPFVTAMSPGANGQFNHYGKILMIGDNQDETKLKNTWSEEWDQSSWKNITTIAKIVPDFANFHLIGTQAADMGVALSPTSVSMSAIVTQHGPIVPVGNDNISQVMNYISTNSKSF